MKTKEKKMIACSNKNYREDRKSKNKTEEGRASDKIARDINKWFVFQGPVLYFLLKSALAMFDHRILFRLFSHLKQCFRPLLCLLEILRTQMDLKWL